MLYLEFWLQPDGTDLPLRAGKSAVNLPEEYAKHVEKMDHGINKVLDMRMKFQMGIDVFSIDLQLCHHE